MLRMVISLVEAARPFVGDAVGDGAAGPGCAGVLLGGRGDRGRAGGAVARRVHGVDRDGVRRVGSQGRDDDPVGGGRRGRGPRPNPPGLCTGDGGTRCGPGFTSRTWRGRTRRYCVRPRNTTGAPTCWATRVVWPHWLSSKPLPGRSAGPMPWPSPRSRTRSPYTGCSTGTRSSTPPLPGPRWGGPAGERRPGGAARFVRTVVGCPALNVTRRRRVQRAPHSICMGQRVRRRGLSLCGSLVWLPLGHGRLGVVLRRGVRHQPCRLLDVARSLAAIHAAVTVGLGTSRRREATRPRSTTACPSTPRDVSTAAAATSRASSAASPRSPTAASKSSTRPGCARWPA